MRDGPKRFRKKPVEVEAIQYRPDIPNCDAVARFLGWSGVSGLNLEGDMEASPGDWIIRGVHGEFYVCRQDIFAVTYEAVTRLDRLCAWLTRHTDRLLFGRPRQPRQWTPRSYWGGGGR